VSPELTQLIELQELDLEIQRVTDRLSRIPIERERIEEEFQQSAAEFLEIKSRYEQTLKDRKQLEAELTTVQQHHEKYKQDLMKVRNQKEYETVLREIDATKKHVGALEGEILKCLEEAEKLESEVNQRTPEVERRRFEVDQMLAEIDGERDEAARRIEELNAKREHLSKSVPRSLFLTYDRMARTRRGQALAVITSDGICTACRMKVRPKVFSDVRKGNELITCESCGRILYYKLETSVEAAKPE
jgi:predicted  nucleic acid-binding Zn-ribbon protein